MSAKSYDVVIAGAGSVGLPAAYHLAARGVKTLVIDPLPSPGQGSNKAAIGGVRATHSKPSKIRLCLDSIAELSSWRERHGREIEWFAGGYVFVAYHEDDRRELLELLEVQQSHGLDIGWLERDELIERVPHLSAEGLLGGTYAPSDGSASPLLTARAYYEEAVRLGAEFHFGERITAIIRRHGRVVGVRTERGGYATATILNAAGAWGQAVARMAGLDVPVTPDSHEAGITEPLAPLFDPMVVDIRPGEGVKNSYFYQRREGQILFCLTPDPPFLGTDRRETSGFLPRIADRMVDRVPILSRAKVRRTWRGLYPMTPDGSPIIGAVEELPGYLQAVGMCGQGYMLGPGVGQLIARLVSGALSDHDHEVLKDLSANRDFTSAEALG